MAAMFARQMHRDGTYHYGATTNPAPHLGRLFTINVQGNAELPKAAPNPATAEEHEAWMDRLRQAGFTVDIHPVEEPQA